MRQRGAVRIGCGARFAGDRPNAALRLLLQVPDMHYLVLECLAEGGWKATLKIGVPKKGY